MTGSPERWNFPESSGRAYARIRYKIRLHCYCAAALMGCAPSLKTDPSASADQTDVGKDYWLTGAVHFCPAPSVSAKCQDVAEGHLKTDSVQKGVKETALGNLPT